MTKKHIKKILALTLTVNMLPTAAGCARPAMENKVSLETWFTGPEQVGETIVNPRGDDVPENAFLVEYDGKPAYVEPVTEWDTTAKTYKMYVCESDLLPDGIGYTFNAPNQTGLSDNAAVSFSNTLSLNYPVSFCSIGLDGNNRLNMYNYVTIHRDTSMADFYKYISEDFDNHTKSFALGDGIHISRVFDEMFFAYGRKAIVLAMPYVHLHRSQYAIYMFDNNKLSKAYRVIIDYDKNFENSVACALDIGTFDIFGDGGKEYCDKWYYDGNCLFADMTDFAMSMNMTDFDSVYAELKTFYEFLRQ